MAERSEAPVAIVGAGPVGLALAVGLARCGVRSVVLEKNPSTSDRSKAPALHIRTREVLCRWNLQERFLEEGTLRQEVTLHAARSGRGPLLRVDFRELDDEVDRPGLLVLEQSHTERLLLEAAQASGLCEVRFGAEVTGLDHGLAGGRLTYRHHGAMHALEAPFVAGCDGAGSFVRRALDLPFDGITYALRPMLADVRIDDARDALPWPRLHNGPGGVTAGIRLSPGLWRVIRLERGNPAHGEAVPDEEIRDRVHEVLGTGTFDIEWSSRFRIHLRSAPRFRVGRVLLCGDAAHVHSPAGGLGMNAGIQDAHNLAWKLAQALDGGDVERLLESFDAERRTVAAERVSRYADVATRGFLQAPFVVRQLAFAVARAAFRIRAVRRRQLRQATMIDLRYEASPILDGGAPAAGMRLPNVRLQGPNGQDCRLYDVLPAGAALLAVGTERRTLPPLPVDAVVRIGPGGCEEPAGLLRDILGGRDGWIMVRPDAYIAWARTDASGLEEAVRYALGR